MNFLVHQYWIKILICLKTFFFLQLKQDNEEFRVMYREGIQGSPFHTLLVEGYIDGPVDVCKLS